MALINYHMSISKRFFQKTLSGNPLLLTMYASIVCFCTYSCMYAFRKPFGAGVYKVGDIDYKVILVIAQGLGYMISKFSGIKIISEMKERGRGKFIIILLSIAALSLLLFAVTPYPYSAVFMFINGLPLGMVWGLVFGYIEGRKITEFIGAMMCVSFIFSSGFMKDVGSSLMKDYHVSEYWMPFATGMIFYVPMLIMVFLLEQIPPPSPEDKAARLDRSPMTAGQRKDLIKKFLPGLIALIITYTMLSTIRDLRDNFIANIWAENGMSGVKHIFSKTENIIAAIIFVAVGLIIIVKDNFKAFLLNHIMIAFGFLMVGVSTLLFSSGSIDPFYWMLFAGLGLYLAYVPFNALFFERLIAAFRISANVGFLMYLSDSFGYLGSLSVLVYKQLGTSKLQWTGFMTNLMLIVSVVGLVGISLSFVYFYRKYTTIEAAPAQPGIENL